MPRTKKRGPLPYIAGEKGRNRVRAFEEKKSGLLFLEWYERALGASEPKRKRVCLPHRDCERAKREADRVAAELGKQEGPRDTEITLRELFDIYMREVSREKGESKRKHDERAAEMFLRFFGQRIKATALNRLHWDRFVAARRRGDIRPAKANKPREVGERVIAYDLKWLLGVLNWATVSGADGRTGVLLERNPLKGLPLPKNECPKRPTLSEAQYQRLLTAADEIGDGFRLALVLAHETGHRIGSIRQLKWSDIDFDGARVRWRAENDKIGYEHSTPLSDDALSSLRRHQGTQKAIGEAWVLPSPTDPTQPCSRHLVRDWWERAALKAELPEGERFGWHSLRRKFATEMKETDLRNLCHMGGWKSSLTILTCYQQPDEERQRDALATRHRRRAGSSA